MISIEIILEVKSSKSISSYLSYGVKLSPKDVTPQGHRNPEDCLPSLQCSSLELQDLEFSLLDLVFDL